MLKTYLQVEAVAGYTKVNFSDLDQYNFNLPPHLIASYPATPVDECRLLVYDKVLKRHQKAVFFELANFLQEGDLLVANDTIVEQRRVFLLRETGARLEAIFLENTAPQSYKVLLKKARRLSDGEILISERDPAITFRVNKQNGATLTLLGRGNDALFEQIGQMPIPPYLNREERPQDRTQYQNYFAAETVKSAAAPTAALHFTQRVEQSLKDRKIEIVKVSLGVGYGTFAPIREENFITKSLHGEFYSIPEQTAKRLKDRDYNRLICIGTTSLRALESAHRLSEGSYECGLSGESRLFVSPPDKVRSIDGLITNFHLPKSSLLLLVSSFISKDELLGLYNLAIEHQYRFFSYGDAMLIL